MSLNSGLLAGGLAGSSGQIGAVEGTGYALQHALFYAWDHSAYFRAGWQVLNTFSTAPFLLPAFFAFSFGGARFVSVKALLLTCKRAFPAQQAGQ